LIQIGSVPEFLDSPDRYREEDERYESHSNIDIESRYDQDKSDEKLWDDMKHATISDIPYSFTGSVDDLLLLTVLEADMVVYRKAEHHLHRSHEKCEPILLDSLEKVHAIEISHEDSPYYHKKPESYNAYKFGCHFSKSKIHF